jgi:sialic acid synthase SpsE
VEVLVKSGAGEVTLLHCVSNYPPRWDEMNLKTIETLQERFCVPVGISDHTPGSTVAIAAVALGARVVEKHVTFDRSQPGPDHPFAMTMEELATMVQQVREVEQALGTGEKMPAPSEVPKRRRIRRGSYDPTTFGPVSGESGIWLRPEHGD